MTPLQRLQTEVIEAGLCTHCGSCVGLLPQTVHMRETKHGPLPTFLNESSPPTAVHQLAYDACPGKGIHYPQANQDLFGHQPQNWLIGCVRQVFIGHSAQPEIRRQGASGGIITQTLLYLLANGRIDGAVVLCLGRTKPWLAEPIIARTPAEIIAASQSVYAPAPVNTILEEMNQFDGRLAYVGLPDQVASLRMLQKAGHPGANKVDVVLGPYVGTNMYQGAISSYLRSHGIDRLETIADLQYRAGEWPGYLQIRTQDGRQLRAEKFYYNYLIPFYITQSSLLAVDFTNELTDISVGDAWHPDYEAQRGGFSVVVARSEQGEALLQEMVQAGAVTLTQIAVDDALRMHGHMIDFKKRGTFIRLNWRQRRGQYCPHFGYHPAQLSRPRHLVEGVITTLFWLCGTRWARKLVEFVPIRIIGPLFNLLRKTWKNVSKPVKRQGLGEYKVVYDDDFQPDSR